MKLITPLIALLLIFSNPAYAKQASKSSIMEMQNLLIDNGYLGGTADGIIGPNTLKAYSSFTRTEGKRALTNIDVQDVIGKLKNNFIRTMNGKYANDYFHDEKSCKKISKQEFNKRVRNALGSNKWRGLNVDLHCDHQVAADRNKLIFKTRLGDRYDSILNYGKENAKPFNDQRRRNELMFKSQFTSKDAIVFDFEFKLINDGDYLRSGNVMPVWVVAQAVASQAHNYGISPIAFAIGLDPYVGLVSNGVVLQSRNELGNWVKIRLELKLDPKKGYEKLYVANKLVSDRRANVHGQILGNKFSFKFGSYFYGIWGTPQAETAVAFRNVQFKIR